MYVCLHREIDYEERTRRSFFTTIPSSNGGRKSTLALVKTEQAKVVLSTYEEITNTDDDPEFDNISVPTEDNIVSFDATQSTITGKIVKRKVEKVYRGGWTVVESRIESSAS